MAAASFRLMAAMPATGGLFTAWLLWELDGQWGSLGTTNQVLAVLLILSALAFSALAFTTLRDAFAPRPAAGPDEEPGHDGAVPDTP